MTNYQMDSKGRQNSFAQKARPEDIPMTTIKP